MVQTGAEAAVAYYWAVTSYGNPLALLAVPASLVTALLIGGLISTIVQVRSLLDILSTHLVILIMNAALLCISHILVLILKIHPCHTHCPGYLRDRHSLVVGPFRRSRPEPLGRVQPR